MAKTGARKREASEAGIENSSVVTRRNATARNESTLPNPHCFMLFPNHATLAAYVTIVA